MLMPSSRQRPTVSAAPCSSTWEPKVIVPITSRETSRSVCGTGRISIGARQYARPVPGFRNEVRLKIVRMGRFWAKVQNERAAQESARA